MLYIKGDRRYTEVEPPVLLEETAVWLAKNGLIEDANRLQAYARMLRAQLSSAVLSEALRSVETGRD